VRLSFGFNRHKADRVAFMVGEKCRCREFQRRPSTLVRRSGHCRILGLFLGMIRCTIALIDNL